MKMLKKISKSFLSSGLFMFQSLFYFSIFIFNQRILKTKLFAFVFIVKSEKKVSDSFYPHIFGILICGRKYQKFILHFMTLGTFK